MAQVKGETEQLKGDHEEQVTSLKGEHAKARSVAEAIAMKELDRVKNDGEKALQEVNRRRITN